MAVPGCRVHNHGPFIREKDAVQYFYYAVVMEKMAEMDIKALLVNPQLSMPHYILDKHYFRKHGANAYYGQNNKLFI